MDQLNREEQYRSIWTDLMGTEFRQGWVRVGGINTRFAQAGNADAPPLIMIHGTAGSWETFSGNLSAHAKHFNCFAIDLVGNGLTEKPDQPYEISVYGEHILEFMRVMKLDKASFIGVSLGAWIVARFALSHPSRTDKLVLLSAAGLLSDESNMSRIREQRGNAVKNPTWESVSSVFARLILEPINRLPDLIAVRQKIYQQPEMLRAMENILVLQDPEIRARNNIPEASWRELKSPTLLIGSIDAPDLYLTTAQALATIIPGALYREMRGVGHWPHFEKPNEFNEMCIRFLRHEEMQ